jgi:hypothetical protein
MLGIVTFVSVAWGESEQASAALEQKIKQKGFRVMTTSNQGFVARGGGTLNAISVSPAICC